MPRTKGTNKKQGKTAEQNQYTETESNGGSSSDPVQNGKGTDKSDESITMEQLHQIIENKARQIYREMNGVFEKTFRQLQTEFQEYKEKQERLVSNLRYEIANKNNKLLDMESKLDAFEQEKLQDTVRIVNLPEVDEDKDLKHNLTAIATSNLKIRNFDKSDIVKVHRLGKQNSKEPCDLIVTFSNTEIRNTFRDSSNKEKLKTEDDDIPVYVNDNLTLRRSKLFYDCRKWRKAMKLHSTWTQRGSIMVKVHETSRPIEISSYEQLRSLIHPTSQRDQDDQSSSGSETDTTIDISDDVESD